MKRRLPALLACLPAPAAAADFGVSAADYPGGAWSPYLVGAGIGVLSWLTFYFAGQAIGASSFYATVAGMVGKLIARRHTEALEYFQSHPPRADWGAVFVLCAILGGFLAAWTGGELDGAWVPAMWADRFGSSPAPRVAAGFIGGVLMAFGARLAGGCTSGHGISGTLQLSAGSWLTVIAMFIGGVPAAMLLYTLL